MATPVFVPIVEIKSVRCHPGADKLDLCDALGWQVCIQKGKYKEGQKLIYFPPDTLLPAAWADKWNVRQYLKGAEKDRIGSIKLRSEPSHGLLMDIPEGQDWPIGTDVSEFFGCTKYCPPVKSCIGDTDKPDDRVPKYTDIQNLRHYPDLFSDGEMVSVTEKIHGQNGRTIIIDGIKKAGSMELLRKPPCTYSLKTEVEIDPIIMDRLGDLYKQLPKTLDGVLKLSKEQFDALKEKGLTKEDFYLSEELSLDNPIVANNNFWFSWTVPAIKALVEGEYAARNAKLVILYGEIFGSKVQKGFEYNVANGKFGYRAFDLLVDGKYIDTPEFREICIQYGVDIVPELYYGPFSLAKIKELTIGKTLLGADHIREGVVVKPVAERSHPKIGRTVLKYVSDEFLATKDGKDFTDV